MIGESKAPANASPVFWLEEKTPQRVLPDRAPIVLMQFETQFGPTKKRLLRIAHFTLDNRRKYHLVCPVEYWPVYEIWEMSGPRAQQDRVVLVSRSSETPNDLLPTPLLVSAQEFDDGFGREGDFNPGDEEDEEEEYKSMGGPASSVSQPGLGPPLSSTIAPGASRASHVIMGSAMMGTPGSSQATNVRLSTSQPSRESNVSMGPVSATGTVLPEQGRALRREVSAFSFSEK